MSNETPTAGYRASVLLPHVKRTGPLGGKHYQYAQDSPTKLKRTHKAICDLLLANPTATYKSIAQAMGMSTYTVSNLVHNDAFKAYMEERGRLILDPAIRAAYKETCDKMFTLAAEIISRELVEKPSFERALKVVNAIGKARGILEPKAQSNTQVNINFPNVLEEARIRARSIVDGSE